jgi:hypothetical protein
MLVVASRTKNYIYENYCTHGKNNNHNYYKNKVTETENVAMA